MHILSYRHITGHDLMLHDMTTLPPKAMTSPPVIIMRYHVIYIPWLLSYYVHHGLNLASYKSYDMKWHIYYTIIMNIQQRTIVEKFDRGDTNLRKLIISPEGTTIPSGYSQFHTSTNPKIWVRIGKALKSTTLTHLIIDLADEFNSQNTIRKLNAIALGLKKNRTIESIEFKHIHFEERFSQRFFVSISKFWLYNSEIRDISLSSCSMDYSSWLSFGYSISKSCSLKRISFDDIAYNELDFVAVSPALQGSLIEFNTTNGRFGEYELEVLSKLWRIDGFTPDQLNFSNNDIDSSACRHLSMIMRSPKTLSLANNDIEDEGIESLFSCFDCNQYNYSRIQTIRQSRTYNGLTSLNLKSTNITDVSCDLLTKKVLMNKSFRLKQLILDDNGITNNGFGIIVGALFGNKHLSQLSISNTYVTTKGWDEMLKQLLCNVSSIDNTYLSNHCLEVCIPPKDYYTDSESGKMIMQMLQINTWSKKEVGRITPLSYPSLSLLTPSYTKENYKIKPEGIAGAQKVLLSHLVNLYQRHESCILSIEDDEDDDDKMIPYVFEWMSFNMNLNNSLLVANAFYHICKHKCHLFEIAQT